MKARPVKKLDPSRSLGENAARIVKVRLDEMLAFAPRALDGKMKAQHDMRIAAKRLRYVLEVTGFCFGRPADTARRRARDLQDILGEIHDCDVMLPRVREHLERAAAGRRQGGAGEGRWRRTSIRGSPPGRLTGPRIAGSTCSPSTWRPAASCSSDRFSRLLAPPGGDRHLGAPGARRRRLPAPRPRGPPRRQGRGACPPGGRGRRARRRQAEAQAEQARLDRERASREAEQQADRHEQIQRRTTPAPRRPT